ncbi:hypothetical protein JR316_0008629 [Psilocybe cubensis]|uniref:Ribosomal RNA methyltransferase FtsJ domain-containing protein n=2 Tax=Psilocybe cubensis TaxID=181762 RepID=A0A8H8CIL8_PSICU|nr:hypothetical protein JR316_0008629 [Psilocybe cubensis]KAH9478176.1 hypothetical protein JR316_0008629 [Psilocybe cubensis]
MPCTPMPVRYQNFLPEQEPDPHDYKVRLVKELIDHGAVILAKLLKLQGDGWNDERIEVHFQKQRDASDNASPHLEGVWYDKMKGLMKEIDTRLKCIPAEGHLSFLDLGCCPGGFSSYILTKNPASRGIGVSLPVEDGGHKYLLEEHLLTRHKLIFANLTKYQLNAHSVPDPDLQHLPYDIVKSPFDLVLLDGHQLRTQISAKPGDMHRLSISQLIIALRTVAPGGTIIMKLPLPHKPIAARILYMLNEISTKICRWKPMSIHANRGTFYVVAFGVGLDPKKANLATYLTGLQNLWFSLSYGGENGGGRYMTDEDLDFIIPVDGIINNHLGWLAEFGNPLWHVQVSALERLYEKNHRKQCKKSTEDAT